jgi:hypothetical protein
MSAANVLDERVPDDHDPGATVLLEPAHRPQPRLQSAVVGLNAIVGVLVSSMPGRWHQLPKHARVHRRVVGDDLGRGDLGCADGMLEEPACRPGVTLRGDEHVDDLAELVDGAVHVPPLAGDLHVGLVDPPTVPDRVTAGPGGVGQQRRESLHPAVDADVSTSTPRSVSSSSTSR